MYLKETKITGLDRIFISNIQGEAINHPLNQSILIGVQQSQDESNESEQQIIPITALFIVKSTESSREASSFEELKKSSCTITGFEEDIIIEVRTTGIISKTYLLYKDDFALLDKPIEESLKKIIYKVYLPEEECPNNISYRETLDSIVLKNIKQDENPFV